MRLLSRRFLRRRSRTQISLFRPTRDMSIPARLRLRPASKDLVDDMSKLCDAIEREVEAGGTAESLLKKWHAHTARQFDLREFTTYSNAVSKETFVREALNPQPSYDARVAYSEVLAVLEAFITVSVSEWEMSYYLHWLEAQFVGSKMNDLINWPDEWFGDASLFRNANGAFKPEAEMTNDQILAYAMRKSGRRLADAPQNIVLPFPMPVDK